MLLTGSNNQAKMVMPALESIKMSLGSSANKVLHFSSHQASSVIMLTTYRDLFMPPPKHFESFTSAQK
jgi:hypothetical protein